MVTSQGTQMWECSCIGDQTRHDESDRTLNLDLFVESALCGDFFRGGRRSEEHPHRKGNHKGHQKRRASSQPARAQHKRHRAKRSAHVSALEAAAAKSDAEDTCEIQGLSIELHPSKSAPRSVEEDLYHIVKDRAFWYDVFVFFVSTLVIIPFSLVLVGLLLALPYSLATNYDYWAATQFVLSNMGGLSTPLTLKEPARKSHGVTVIISTVAYVIVAIETGLITQLPMMRKLIIAENIRPSTSLIGSLRTIFRTIVLACTLIVIYIACSSIILRMCERGTMDFKQCFLYTFSNAIGLCTPLTDKIPENVHGRTFAVVGAFSNLGVLGVVIGLVSELNVFNDIHSYALSATRLVPVADFIRNVDAEPGQQRTEFA